MQLNKTPQITFGIKHSPLLGQLKPIEPHHHVQKEVTQKITSQTYTSVPANREFTPEPEAYERFVQKKESDVVKHNGDVNEYKSNEFNSRRNLNESDESNIQIHNTRTHVTQLRAESELRSSTATPEPVQETITQDLVWVPEKPVRRGSYTIDKSDGFTEQFQNSEVIPVENGVIRTAASGEKGAACLEESSSKVIRGEGFEQSVKSNIKNASTHEKSQTATEDVRTGTNVQHLPNGGIAKTTTTTTVRKVGTAARTANATTSVTRTATAVTSRDVGTK